MLGDGLGGNGDVGHARQHVLAHLPGVALMEGQPHVWIARHEGLHDRRQCVAGLGVRKGNRQAAGRLVAEFGANLAQVVDFLQNARRDGENLLAGLGDFHQALAVTHENLDAQLLLQQADLLGDAGLGCEQGLGRLRHVQPVTRHLEYIPQLLNVQPCPLAGVERQKAALITFYSISLTKNIFLALTRPFTMQCTSKLVSS